MFGLIATGVGIALVTGAIAKLVMDHTSGPEQITRRELITGAAILTLALVPLTAYIGTKVAVASNSKFNEYWNGWETAADAPVTTCTRDGACSHTYTCDPYTVMETYTTTDSKGNTQWHTRPVTHWHECPVGTQEADYVVRTTVGDATISSGQFTPDTRPWRDGTDLEGVPTQPPAQWVAARDRLAADNPGPATSVHTYDNWVLASQRTVLHHYSDAIARYSADGLLPPPAAGVRDHYLADKAHFVGWTPTAADTAAWQDAVGRTAAALGTQKQGDLEVVLVRSDKVTDPDEYVSALMAAWQAPDLGRDALAKNAVVLVAGTTDGSTVAWARVATGMPVGNSGLQVASRTELVGDPWTPAGLVGTPTVRVTGSSVTTAATTARGALETLLWDPTNGFTRVCMSCKGDDGIGYDYLKGEITPTTGQNVAIVAVMAALSLAMWFGFALAGEARLAPVRQYVNTPYRERSAVLTARRRKPGTVDPASRGAGRRPTPTTKRNHS